MTGPRGVSAVAREVPGRTALVCGDAVRTFAELDERSTRVAHVLRAHGVAAGDRVAVMLPNGMEFFEVGVAVSKLDAVLVPINTHLTTDEVAWILGDSACRVLLAHARMEDRWAGAVDGRGPGRPPPTVIVGADYEDALAAVGPAPAPLEAAAAASPMFYTSGTTGRPKGVHHGSLDRERMQLAQEGLAALWGFTPDDVYILSGPAYHAGPGGYAMTALFVGAPVVILERWDACEWLRLVAAHGVTCSFMVPAHFIRVLEVDDDVRGTYDLASLRLVIHGAAPCPVAVKRRMFDVLAPAEIWELYGASEGGATRISPAEWLEHPGSVGTPWPGITVRILNAEGREVAPGVDGLVYVVPAGGARFRYHNDEGKTDAAWLGNAFTVGDVGHLDSDGYLYITDRLADMVIRGGVNVYPREVEEVLHRHDAVVDVAVFGVPDDRMGEVLKAVVEVRSPVDPLELVEHCRAHLAAFKCPEIVELVDELPRDAAGKVRKRLLRDAHWIGRPTAVG